MMLHYAVGRIDCAITALGCVAQELVEGGDDTSEAASVAYLYEVLRDEAKNLRACVDALRCCRMVEGVAT
jgi:hypothetical protein